MNVVGKFGSLISQGVYSVATPFHPFGGAVDIIVVQQQDGTFRSTPWYVRFGKFQGVLKGAEKMVGISVNGVEVDFNMHLDNSGEAYFVREVDLENENKVEGDSKDLVGTYRLEHSISDSGVVQLRNEFESSGASTLDRCESDLDRRFYDFQDDQTSQEDSVELSEYGSSRYENLDNDQIAESDPNSEVVLISVDGHVLTAPISDSEKHTDDVELNTPHLHLGPGEGADFCEGNEDFGPGENAWDENYIGELGVSAVDTVPELNTVQNINGVLDNHCENHESETCDVTDHEGQPHVQDDSEDVAGRIDRRDVFKSCLELQELGKPEAADDGTSSPSESRNLPEKFTGSPQEVDEVAGGSRLEVSNGEQQSPTHSLGKNPSLKNDDVEIIQNNALASENGLSLNISDNNSLHTDVLLEDGQDCGPVVIETMKGSSERGDSEDECTMREMVETETTVLSVEVPAHLNTKIEISLCRNELHPGMGFEAAAQAFDAHRVSVEEFQNSMASIVKNENLVVRYAEKYLSWEKAAPIVLGLAAFSLDFPVDSKDIIGVDQEDVVKPIDNQTGSTPSSTPNSAGRRWRLWPIPFRRIKTLEHQSSSSSNEDVFVDSEPSQNVQSELTIERNSPILGQGGKSPRKQLIRTNIPTTEQIASLNLKEGQNMITFSFSTRVLGRQQVDAHIYLWMWNARIVISDVDGTITKSDVLGQFMPLVGKDWTQSGVARLFSAIKENGYQLLFLSARAIVQAYLTRSFLLNLKQDGKALPNGPVVISPDGLFPSLYREVIRRAPHEFKIACLEDIKALFPSDYNPFYAGFGNRDTDELSYRKIGIPKGKIFIINPKGEVASSHRIDVKSYTSLHTLVNDMFPPTSLVEQEDYNSWNFWRMPLPDIEC